MEQNNLKNYTDVCEDYVFWRTMALVSHNPLNTGCKSETYRLNVYKIRRSEDAEQIYWLDSV